MINSRPNVYFINLIFHFGVFAALFIHAISATCQQTTPHNGPYKVSPSISGTATFSYFISKGDTIKHGDFKFKSSVESNLFFENIVIEGQYENGLKTGPWKHVYSRLTPLDESSVDGLNLVKKTSGKRITLLYNFNRGLRTGQGYALVEDIKNSAVSDTGSYCRTNFLDNLFSGELYAKTPDHEIKVSFDDKGQVHGLIDLYNAKSGIREIRSYNHGKLTKHKLVYEESEKTLSYELLDKTDTLEPVPLDQKIGDAMVMALASELKNGDDSASVLNEVKCNNQALLNSIAWLNPSANDSLTRLFGLTPTGNHPQVKVHITPFSEIEKSRIKTAVRQQANSIKIIQNFKTDPQVELNLKSNRRLSLYHALLEIYEQRIFELEPLTKMLANPAVEYLNREVLLRSHYEEAVFPDSVRFVFEGKQASEFHEFPRSANMGELGIENIAVESEKINQKLTLLELELAELLAQYKKQSLLTDMENDLVAKRDTIEDLFGNGANRKDFNNLHHLSAPRVLKLVNDKMNHYANLDLEEKTSSLDAYIQCFDRFIKLYNDLIIIDKKIKNVDVAYTRTVWNPYTFTDMTERVKEKVYEVYELTLLPDFTNELTSQLTCESVDAASHNMHALLDRMIEIREIDTKDLEKQVRKMANSSELIDALKIEVSR